MSVSKPRVALHYVKPGVNRSPNILFDRIESSEFIQKKYEIVHLNQSILAGGKISLKLIITLVREIKVLKPDIIHISGIAEGFHCMIAATIAGCKNRVIITHGFASLVEKQPALKRGIFKYVIEPITLLLATKIQCNSLFSLNQKVIKRFGKRKSLLIYNIPPEIEAKNIQQDLDFREKYGIDESEIIFVSVGRIVKKKGFEVLAEAIKKLEKLEKIRFVIIGQGEYKTELEELLKDEVERKKVILTGTIQNREVLSIMSESNVFVLPTMLFETYGLVFIEAALLKLPSIATNIAAVPEVVVNDETGLLIPINDVEALENSIKLLYKHPELIKAMGEKAYIRGNKFFSKEKIVKDIDKMYRSLLNDRE